MPTAIPPSGSDTPRPARAARTPKAAKAPKSPRPQKTLTEEMSGLLAKVWLPDLRQRAHQPAVERALRQHWQAERDHKRTAADFDDWSGAAVEQIGAAWILSCIFVRVLEARGLTERRRIAGEGADDSLQQFLEIAPSLTERDYLLTVFRELATYPGAADVLDPAHNPAWRLSPSNDSVRALLALLRETGADGSLRFRFEGTDTRFLGDLYQDLSESVRKRYALLQTPVFVERFILDQTLEPAIAEFGLEQVRLIDPTCGSGHFLLGAFHRLFEHRQRAAPATDRREHAKAALDQVTGVDINPYAVAIARFRLTLAYLEHAGIDRLAQAPRIATNLVVADSLLHGTQQVRFAEREDDAAWVEHDMFTLDDPEGARRVFGQNYHAVVGNPPYITCKDAVLREEYRRTYDSASGSYALCAPFTERFFMLAEPGAYIGMINANSFMKREFGKALIEKVLLRLELTEVVDTSGAYIPGAGTPTIILFGRNRAGVSASVHTVMGKRGEPATPDDPAKGLVWSTIAAHHAEIGFENDYVSVADVPRETFNKHPWSLGGGGAADLKQLLETRCNSRLQEFISAIGRTTHTGEDSFFFVPPGVPNRLSMLPVASVPLITGEQLRDWSADSGDVCLFPYFSDGTPRTLTDAESRHYWCFRTLLKKRQDYGETIEQRGLLWYQHSMFFPDRFRTPLSIAFAFVATHNHFVLDRGGKVFNRSAPIIKLPPTATEDDHLALLAYLNSSTACFWMKQVFMNKGATSDKGVLQDDPDKFRFEFDGTKLASCPIPDRLSEFRDGLLISLARQLSDLGAGLSRDGLFRLLSGGSVESLEVDLNRLLAERSAVRRRMVALQECIDWAIYELVGLLSPAQSDGLQVLLNSLPELEPDQRTFMNLDTNTPLSELARASAQLTLIERGEYKRRWYRSAGKFNASNVTDVDLVRDATTEMLLDRVEAVVRSAGTPTSIKNVLAAIDDGRVQTICRVIGLEFPGEVGRLAFDESIPFCAQLRFADSGREKHLHWCDVWELQRREDRGEKVSVPVPERYGSEDFASARYWSLRGKLDVPKERFISYPGCERDDDKSPLIGWAGWNHLQRAQALATLFQERKDQDGWPAERLVPMLAGLLELVPWLKQWHNEPDPAYDGQRMGDVYEGFVSEKARELQKTLDDLRSWRPETPAAGRQRVAADKADKKAELQELKKAEKMEKTQARAKTKAVIA